MEENGLSRYLRSRPKTAAARRWGCLDDSQIAAYADGRAGEKERQRIEAHLAECEFCLEQTAFLARIENTPLPESVPGSVLSRAQDLVRSRPGTARIPAWRQGWIPAWTRLASAAAVACLAVAVTLSVRYSHLRTRSVGSNPLPQSVEGPPSQPASQTVSGTAESTRGASESAGLVVLFPAVESAVPRKDMRFRWEAVPGALQYDVRVLTAEGDLVWQQQTESTFVQFPNAVRVEPNRRYYLMVRADLGGGRTVESKAVAFSVTD